MAYTLLEGGLNTRNMLHGPNRRQPRRLRTGLGRARSRSLSRADVWGLAHQNKPGGDRVSLRSLQSQGNPRRGGPPRGVMRRSCYNGTIQLPSWVGRSLDLTFSRPPVDPDAACTSNFLYPPAGPGGWTYVGEPLTFATIRPTRTVRAPKVGHSGVG